MVNLELWKNDRNASRSIVNDIWGMFDDLERSFFVPIGQRSSTEMSMAPACDVTETDGAFLLSIDVPGLRKEDINIEIKGRQLAVSGERKHEEESQNGSAHRIERSYGKFHRTFDLPTATNTEVVEASYDNGVLKIAIPKVESEKPRKIPIAEAGKGLFKWLAGNHEAKAINS